MRNHHDLTMLASPMHYLAGQRPTRHGTQVACRWCADRVNGPLTSFDSFAC